MFRHIRWKLLAAYLVVILLALAFLGVHLTRDSETRYLAQVEAGLLAQARLIAVHVSEAVATGKTARTQAELQGTQFPGNPSVVVVDTAEQIVALYTAQASPNTRHDGRDGIRAALRGGESTGAARDGGVPVVYGAVPIRNGGQIVGAVYVALPLKELAEQFQHIRIVVGWTILATLFWAAIVSLLLANRIAGPIHEMRTATARVAAGELGERVTARTNDELGDLARSFNYMAAELERLDTMRREFVADASHELRTPVANLAVAVDALRGSLSPADPSVMALLEGIEREVERLRVLVETLLDLSAIESGRVQLHMVTTNLSDVADRAIQSFEPRAAHQGIALERARPGRPLLALADPDRMAQVLSNLIDNALKFTPSGGRVTVTVGERRGRATVIVDDTGPGIPAADLPSIFDRFFKADRSRSGRRGAGLGLAIAKRLMAAQGGTIIAENRPEGGARFVITLPVS